MSKKIADRGLKSEFIIDSAGTSDEEEGNAIYPPAARKLRSEGVPILNHRAKRLCKRDYDSFDLFLCAEQRNVNAAKRILDDGEGKVIRMLDFSDNPRDIADPWWTGDFDSAYRDIDEACDSIIAYALSSGLIKG